MVIPSQLGLTKYQIQTHAKLNYHYYYTFSVKLFCC